MSIVGARPNFVKVAPLIEAMRPFNEAIAHRLVHTGQHYDAHMSKAFFDDLELPRPDVDLKVGSGSHAEQTAGVMVAVEPVLADFRPDMLIVVGDVNSTLAAALTAKKMGIAVAHVEAGLRSFDMTMPEEVNRLCTDAISDLLFTTDRLASGNLESEGIPKSRVHFVGNVMIDSLMMHREKALDTKTVEALNLTPGGYATLTLHRPSNVDHRGSVKEILDAVSDGVGDMPVVFPAHPRTRQRIEDFGLASRFCKNTSSPGICIVEPLGYLQFLDLNSRARLALTDSGGIQEETSILGVPCVTLRQNTERPITLTEGTNHLAGTDRQGILAAISKALGAKSKPRQPEKWDGRASERIVSTIMDTLNDRQ